MRAMRAESFTGYGALKLVEVPRPRVSAGRILVRITAAGVSPLDHTILSGGFPFAKAPLILGNEGAGVVESSDDSSFPAGARVMFFGRYGVSEDGTYSESIAVRREDLFLIPDYIDDATAGCMPVAYLTAQITHLARAQGAGLAISATTSPAKAKQARALGFEHVIDLSAEDLAQGVARIAGGRGVDVVIESVGGALTGQALGTLSLNGVLTTLGYSAGRKTTIDVTDLIWKR